ncbi:MAG: hypothetical protein H0Z33_16625 [Bacillaceae bacterium]|nr:hypothetical protein [Bacillaceae bacterium]
MMGKVEIDGFKLKGHVKIQVYNAKTGETTEEEFDNLVVNAGKAEVAQLIGSGLGGTAFTHIAIGTGTTAAAATDTALEAEVTRKAATITNVTDTVTNDTAQFEASFSSADGLTGTSAITEYGLFNDATAGTMLSRVVQSAKNIDWDAGDTLSVTWKVTVQ